jgi:hypothetical protein
MTCLRACLCHQADRQRTGREVAGKDKRLWRSGLFSKRGIHLQIGHSFMEKCDIYSEANMRHIA